MPRPTRTKPADHVGAVPTKKAAQPNRGAVPDRKRRKPADRRTADAPRWVAYARVSTEEQARSGLGLAAQREAIAGEAERRGWDVEWIVDDGYTAATMSRPGITRALEMLANGEAEGIVVSKLDRLSRSVTDFAATLDLARRQGWALIAMDLGVDTSTPAGELVANVMASVAQWERRVIAQRTTDALAAAKSRGQRLGRPRATSPDVVAKVVALSASMKPGQVARVLTAEGVPTTRGATQWKGCSVRRILNGVALDAIADTQESKRSA
jgi:DNA invertase Pin-like site-specific DNA recombinase